MTLSELQKCRPSASNPWWDANFGGTCDHRRDVPRRALRKFVLKHKPMKHPRFFWNTKVWFTSDWNSTQGAFGGPKEASSFFLFHMGIKSSVWNLGILPWTHQLDQIRTIPWKTHEKSLESMTHHHSLYGSFLCPCWNSNFEPLVSIHVKS